MKKKQYILLISVTILVLLLLTGIEPHTSSSAFRDLTAALTELHGEPYVGREVEGGTEDMTFSIESGTFFLSGYNLRKALGLDYRFLCKVIYTTHSPAGETHTRTITYTGYDPMGKGEDTARAYIDPASRR